MGEATAIAWTDHTLNPWTRCTRISPGCDNCYAATWANRATHPKDATGHALPVWGDEAPRDETKRWEANLAKWDRAAREAGVRRRVFCASLADVFEDHPAITPETRARLFAALARCTNLNVQLLTKRPENVLRMVPPSWLDHWPEHVWAMTTVENQEQADIRIPHLLRVPAPVRGLSVEPMLEAVNISHYLPAWFCDACGHFMLGRGDDGCAVDEGEASPCCSKCRSLRVRPEGIQWLICGGESGPKARPSNRTWARSLRDQCQAAGVAFFYKQEGARMFDGAVEYRFRADDARANPAGFPADLRVQTFPTP